MSTTAELSENSPQGFEGLKAALCLVSMDAKSNTASGLRPCLRRNCIGSRCSGKERDETGLDYFGARYFSGALGRFTSADAPFADQHSNNPQSWNLFIYALNNPLRFVDMDGFAVIPSEKIEYFKIEGATTAAQAAIQANNYYQGGPQYRFTMQVINMNPSNAKITVKDGSFKAASSLISADVKLDITIKLPEWHSDDPAEQAIFDNNLEVIKSHERDHVEGAHAEAEALDKSLPGTPGEGEGATGQEAAKNAAKDMRDNVSEKQHNAVKKINKRDEELDDKTKHGTVPLPRNY